MQPYPQSHRSGSCRTHSSRVCRRCPCPRSS